MAQAGFTPILIYSSGSTGNTPSAGNLTNSSSGSELALNYYDGKLFYKDASGTVQTLAYKNVPVSTLSGAGTGVLVALAINANATGGFPTTDGAATLTNKRIDPRVSSTTSTASITPDISAYDQYCVTAQAATLTINAPIGTPVDGDKLIFRILDNGGAQTLSWNATFTAIGVTIPTSTTAGKMTYVGCIYNAANTRWDVVAVTTQA